MKYSACLKQYQSKYCVRSDRSGAERYRWSGRSDARRLGASSAHDGPKEGRGGWWSTEGQLLPKPQADRGGVAKPVANPNLHLGKNTSWTTTSGGTRLSKRYTLQPLDGVIPFVPLSILSHPGRLISCRRSMRQPANVHAGPA